MATEIYLVKVGMTMTEGMVEEWYVADGSPVAKGELLYRLETEKVNLDVDADASGIVQHGVAVGVTMKPGDVIGHIYAPGEPVPAHEPATGAATASAPAATTSRAAAPAAAARQTGGAIAASPAARRLARELNVDIAHATGSGPGGRIVEADVRAAAAAPQPMRAATSGPASPLAKRIAAELGVDLSQVTGTGPGGRITKEDVERTARPAPAAAPPQHAPNAAAAPASTADTTIPLKGIRKTTATRMLDSLHGSAQLTMDMDVTMDDAVKLRGQLIDEWQAEQIRPTYTDLVVKAVAKALRLHPSMNSVFGATEITLLGDVHVGIAVAIDTGLVVPVIRNADTLSLKALAFESARLATAARASTLALDDMAGGTFTVTALGMYGVDSFTPILNAPQSGILGVNRIRDDVAWQGDRAVPRKTLRLSLTWDHRALDGVPAALFLGSVRDLLEAPFRLLV
jgi:pyruvate dehydrogenase E2 component (dihydrolipoamide acetyltransferase)